MNFVIITGISGSGKSQALKFMEDMGYFCVDNLPPMLIGNLADACLSSHGKIRNVAVVMDVRGGEFFSGIFEALASLDKKGIARQVLFLDASTEVLVKRYKETRHTHPLENGSTLIDSIAYEKKLLLGIREKADLVIDTSSLSTGGLRREMQRYFSESGFGDDKIHLNVISFGYKRGIPADADMVFDARFLPNPYYDEKLRTMSGKTAEVRAFLLSCPETLHTADRIVELLDYILPLYARETKNNLNFAIGCTGGMHRSVLLAELVGQRLAEKYDTQIQHRDLAEEEARILAKFDKE